MFSKPKTPQAGGMEMMFRSLGLGPILDAAHQFVAAGGVQKITEFADALPEIRERLERIEAALSAGNSVEPGPGDLISRRVVIDDEPRASDADQPAGQSRRRGKPNGVADAGH